MDAIHKVQCHVDLIKIPVQRGRQHLLGQCSIMHLIWEVTIKLLYLAMLPIK